MESFVHDSLNFLPISEIPSSVLNNIKQNFKQHADLKANVFIQDLNTDQFQYLPDNYRYVVTVEKSNVFNIFDAEGFSVVKSKKDTELRKVYQLLIDYLSYKKLKTTEVNRTLQDFMDALSLSANNLSYIFAVQDYISRRILAFYKTEREASYTYYGLINKNQFKILKIYNPYPITY